MNRIFKRLPQAANVQDQFDNNHEIKFTFDGKTYSAQAGDTIEVALFVNNLLKSGRTKTGYYACSASGLYKNIVDVIVDEQNYTICASDFIIRDGLKLVQTHKRTFRDSFSWIGRILSPKALISDALEMLDAQDITRSILHLESANLNSEKLIGNLAANIEKSYIHADITIVGMNIFALQAAYALAQTGLYVVLCDDGKGGAYSCFYNPELQETFNTLYQTVQAHQFIRIYQFSDLRILDEQQKNISQVIGVQRTFYTSSMNDVDHDKYQNFFQLSVINSKKVIFSPNLQEVGFHFSGHHLPAVMGIHEYMGLYLKSNLAFQQNVVLYVSNDMAYDILSLAHCNPQSITAIIDTRIEMSETMIMAEKAGYKIYAGYYVHQVQGKYELNSVSYSSINNNNFLPLEKSQENIVHTLKCDLLLHSAGYMLDLEPLSIVKDLYSDLVSDDFVKIPNSNGVLKNNIYVTGYYDCKLGQLFKKSSVQNICNMLLKDLSLQVQIDDLYQINISWDAPEIYGVFPNLPKENVIFPQDIRYSHFIQILHQTDDPLAIIQLLGQYRNFYHSHWAIRTLLSMMQEIYNFTPEKIADFYLKIIFFLNKKCGLPSAEELKKVIPISGYPMGHIMPKIDGHYINSYQQIKTNDHHLKSQKLQAYYHKIKSCAGIRLFQGRHIIDISGLEADFFLKDLIDDFDISVSEYKVINEKKCINPTIIMRLQPHKYYLISDQYSELMAKIQLQYLKNTSLKAVVTSLDQGWAQIQLVGENIKTVFEKITNISREMLNNTIGQIWLENIPLIYVNYTHYDTQHIDFFIVSDAANSFYTKIMRSNAEIYPFSTPVYEMIALEAGYIFNLMLLSKNKDNLKSEYTTQALAVPLDKSDNPVCHGDIFKDKQHQDQEPEGVLLETKIYSPFYNQYIMPVLLRGDLQKWENKTVAIINQDKSRSMQVKIISEKMHKISEVA